MTSFVIVVLKGDDVGEKGQIVQVNGSTNIQEFKSLAAKKLGLLDGLEFLVKDESDNKLESIQEITKNNVVIIEPAEFIQEINGPTPLPFVGNIFDLIPDPLNSHYGLFKKYGDCYKIHFFGNKMIFLCHPDLAEKVVPESEYFTKKIKGPFLEVKAIGGEGLFTTDTTEFNWKLAHKLLLPAFSAKAMKAYTAEMCNIAHRTVHVISQYEPDEQIPIATLATNLTFETIGKIGFGYDFHLLDARDCPTHPFIEAMNFCLRQSFKRSFQLEFYKKLSVEANYRYDREMKLMKGIVDEVVKARKESPDAKEMKKDLLGFMLNARDDAGIGLSDEIIRDQVITFLVAGHETTSNTIAWTLYELNRNPDVLRRILQEIVDVGINDDEQITQAQVSSLNFTEQVIKETLRLHSPIRDLNKYCIKDTVLPGGYLIRKGDLISVSLNNLHRNPKIWPNPHTYNPDRWTKEEETKRSSYSWLPFSYDARGCIGRMFAMQEAKIVLAVLLHKFEFFTVSEESVTYDQNTPTLRPLNLLMTVKPRTNFPPPSSESSSVNHDSSQQTTIDSSNQSILTISHLPLPKLTILYGSNTGGSEDYANQSGVQAKSLGFQDVSIKTLDEWEVISQQKYDILQGNDEIKELVIVITSTYNGTPPDNASKFNKWIDSLNEDEQPLKGLHYTVFGCGNSQWKSTYQSFPKKVDASFDKLGAERFFELGEGNADGKDIDADFSEWFVRFSGVVSQYYSIENAGNKVFSALTSLPTSGVDLEYFAPDNEEAWSLGKSNKNGDHIANVNVNKELQNTEKSKRSTRHLEISLPEGVEYEVGDHLEVWAENSEEIVESVALSFGLVLDSVFEIKKIQNEQLSSRSLATTIKGPCTVRNAFRYYADLSAPPTKTLLKSVAQHLKEENPESYKILSNILQLGEEGNEAYSNFVKKYRTIHDLQEDYPVELSLEEVLCGLQIITPRRYSISSSPKVYQREAHITVAINEYEENNKHYQGLCSGFLQSSHVDNKLHVSVKSVKDTFKPPQDPTVPIVMIGSGTGLAPFRGFLQDRQKDGFKSVAKGGVSNTHLFFGCRYPDNDYLYKEELEQFVENGTLDQLHVAFSRNQSVKKYVQHDVLANSLFIWQLIESQKGVVYVCGSASTMAVDVRKAFEKIARQIGGLSADDAKNYVGVLQSQGRFVEDVWG